MKKLPALSRALFVLVLAAVVPLALAACGGDDSDEPQTLTFTATSQGNDVKLTGPATAESGEAEITLENSADGAAELQLIRVEGDQTIDQATQGLVAASQGQPFPEWFDAGGGVGRTRPGDSQTVTQVLEPGTYYAFDTGSREPTADNGAQLTVTGDATDESLEADATVSAFEYDFETEGLTAGENEVLFENTGSQPHHVIYAPIKGDATVDEIEKSLREEKGPPPIDFTQEQATAVLEGGGTQLVNLDFAEPGRYALLCFISDRQGGPPHAFKGMIAEVDVE